MSESTLIAFSLAGERYGMACREVAAVLPLARLSPAAGADAALAGTLDFHGTAVPVVDLGRLVTGRPCADHLSTRILVVDCGRARAGLMVERADETCRADVPPAAAAGPRVFKVSRDGSGKTAAAAVPLGPLLDRVLRSRLTGAASAHGPGDLQ
ncbi:MAG: chemotaxis protein CheW [Elusimicrobia bacterium]|nr:chemotaxis protein CheW [Elusimicrobiota bacterium]